jgi:hypothetical protein
MDADALRDRITGPLGSGFFDMGRKLRQVKVTLRDFG